MITLGSMIILLITAGALFGQRARGSESAYPADSALARYGHLQVRGKLLCDQRGTPVNLHGVFIRGLTREAKYVNEKCFRTMVDEWKVEVIRVPFMSAQWYSEPSYIGDANYEGQLYKAIELCEKLGVYCIVDWHVLGDGNPMTHAKEAEKFFTKLSKKYAKKTHLIYELCNEPNGKEVSWDGVVKPYAESMIRVIRKNAPESIVIVGSSTWSQDVDIAARNPLTEKNILYAFHFYAGSHKQDLRDKVARAAQTLPLFSSEWGTSNYDAQGGPFVEESTKWIEFMRERNIGWCHYALTDFPESAAMLKTNTPATGEWKQSDLTASGAFIVEYLKNGK